MRKFIHRTLARMGLTPKSSTGTKNEESFNWTVITQNDIENMVESHENEKTKLDIVNFEFKLILQKTNEGATLLAHNQIDKEFYVISVFRRSTMNKLHKYDLLVKDLRHNMSYGLNHLHVVESLNYTFVIKSEDYLCTLHHFIKSFGRLSEKHLKYIASQILRKLNRMHKNGLLYLNLTPLTIVVDINCKLHLSEFQYVIDYKSKHVCLHRQENIDILPPEIFYDSHLDQTADLYSLGILLYQLLLGKKPIEANEIFKYEKMVHQTSPYIKKDMIPETVSLECVDFINRLLQMNKKHRLGILRTKDAFLHPWFSRMIEKSDKEALEPFKDSMIGLISTESCLMYRSMYDVSDDIDKIFEEN